MSQSQVSVAGYLSAEQELNVHYLVDKFVNMINKYDCGYYNYNCIEENVPLCSQILFMFVSYIFLANTVRRG